MSDTQHWAVSVDRNGENIVTIESHCLSGRDLSDEDQRVIELSAHHLLSFLGLPAAASSRRVEEVIRELIAEWREDVAAERKLGGGGYFMGGVDEKEACANALEVALTLPCREGQQESKNWKQALDAYEREKEKE